LVGLVLLATLGSVAVPALAATPNPNGVPRVNLHNGTSINWSGYAIAAADVTDVQGSWVLPSVDCAGNQDLALSSAWVGIDGDVSGTVEQIGTDQLCDGAQEVYFAWVEMYPAVPRTLMKLDVHPGDRLSGEVQWSKAQTFILRLTNETTGQSYQTRAGRKAERTSAEWIVECPGTPGRYPLADFGTVRFENASATIDGLTGSISTKAWATAVEPITMVAADEATVRAVPSGLRQGGIAFSVAWQHR
jgi:hypothetical protein